MTRILLVFVLCAQVLAANPAIAAARCPHAAMGATAPGQQATSVQARAAHASQTPGHEHCHCHCNLAGHCGSGMGALQSVAPAISDARLPFTVPLASATSTARAYKHPPYRPPSSL